VKVFKAGFTLIEMLIVMGIIAVLSVVALTSYSAYVSRAQTVRCGEYVHSVSSALAMMAQSKGSWSLILLQHRNNNDGILSAEAGAALARQGVMTLTCKKEKVDDDSVRYVLTGHERLGLLTPWAQDVIRKSPGSTTLSSPVPSGGTIADHRLHFAIDEDFDGITEVALGHKGTTAKVRAAACVWCCGRDGKIGTKDDVRSWTKAQEVQ